MTDTIDGAAPLKDACVKKRGRRTRALAQAPPEVMERLDGMFPRELLEEALEGLDPEAITRPGGLITQLAGRVVEAALAAELTAHLGHPPGGVPAGANVRNGGTAKTLSTDLGPVQISTPRDRDASFEPQLVAKRQTRLAGLDERVLDLYAGGLSVRDIAAHLTDLYGIEVGRDTISRVTGAVLEDVAAWRTRPLDPVYAIVYFDALRVKVREDRSVQNRACYRGDLRRRYTDEQIRRAVALVARGSSIRAAATAVGAREGAVHEWLRNPCHGARASQELAARRGAAPGGDLRRRYSDEQIDRAVTMVANGSNITTAAAAVGATLPTVLRWLRKAA